MSELGADVLMDLPLKIEIFRENDVFVAVSPELNVSSFGETIDEAKESLKEAVDAFIEECRDMGTIDEVLEEAGFRRTRERWEPRKPLIEDNLSISF